MDNRWNVVRDFYKKKNLKGINIAVIKSINRAGFTVISTDEYNKLLELAQKLTVKSIDATPSPSSLQA